MCSRNALLGGKPPVNFTTNKRQSGDDVRSGNDPNNIINPNHDGTDNTVDYIYVSRRFYMGSLVDRGERRCLGNRAVTSVKASCEIQ